MLRFVIHLRSAGELMLSPRTRLREAIIASAWIVMAVCLAARLRGQSESLPLSYFHNQPMHIGNQIQLVADDYMVEDRWMLKRTVGHVLKHLRNPILVQDKPWEG